MAGVPAQELESAMPGVAAPPKAAPVESPWAAALAMASNMVLNSINFKFNPSTLNKLHIPNLSSN